LEIGKFRNRSAGIKDELSIN